MHLKNQTKIPFPVEQKETFTYFVKAERLGEKITKFCMTYFVFGIFGMWLAVVLATGYYYIRDGGIDISELYWPFKAV